VNVATRATAVRNFGRLSLGDDLQPAIALTNRGFAVNFDFNQLEQSSLSTLQAYPASRSLLLTPSGDPLPVGTWLRDPDLAHTCGLIARQGPSALYDGPIGRAIVQADDHPVLTPGRTIVTNPGIMTVNDLRSYRTRILAPTQVTYRGLSIYGMAPPSSGGSTEGAILNILNGYPLGSEPRPTGVVSSASLQAASLAGVDGRPPEVSQGRRLGHRWSSRGLLSLLAIYLRIRPAARQHGGGPPCGNVAGSPLIDWVFYGWRRWVRVGVCHSPKQHNQIESAEGRWAGYAFPYWSLASGGACPVEWRSSPKRVR
jgi:Gamma-glutamyltranspeptidase